VTIIIGINPHTPHLAADFQLNTQRMNYKQLSAWIFAVLMILVVLMILFPTSIMLIIGTVGLPILIAVQVFVILKAREQSHKHFGDGDWYDKP